MNSRCQVVYHQNTIKLQLDSFGNGGKLDAFRHVFFMAAFSQKVSIRKLRKLGIAHENQNYRTFLAGEDPKSRHDSLAMVMDLFNNELAFLIGRANRHLSLEALRDEVILHLKNGEAKIMRRNKAGEFTNCEGKPIPDENANWYLPRCLVPSNFGYID